MSVLPIAAASIWDAAANHRMMGSVMSTPCAGVEEVEVGFYERGVSVNDKTAFVSFRIQSGFLYPRAPRLSVRENLLHAR